MRNFIYLFFVILICFAFLIYVLFLKVEYLYSSRECGVDVHLLYVETPLKHFINKGSLTRDIGRTMVELDKQLSLERKNSDINRINSANTTDKIKCGNYLFQLCQVGRGIYNQTYGIYDPSLAYHYSEQEGVITVDHKEFVFIKHRKISGFDRFIINDDNTIQKLDPAAKLSLVTIIPGFTVDKLVEIMRRRHIKNFLVEAGGQIYASGINANARDWQVIVPDPVDSKTAFCVIALRNGAVATSGKYFLSNPKEHELMRVTVLSESSVTASMLANSAMLLGKSSGYHFVQSFPKSEALFLTYDLQQITSLCTPGFPFKKSVYGNSKR